VSFLTGVLAWQIIETGNILKGFTSADKFGLFQSLISVLRQLIMKLKMNPRSCGSKRVAVYFDKRKKPVSANKFGRSFTFLFLAVKTVRSIWMFLFLQ